MILHIILGAVLGLFAGYVISAWRHRERYCSICRRMSVKRSSPGESTTIRHRREHITLHRGVRYECQHCERSVVSGKHDWYLNPPGLKRPSRNCPVCNRSLPPPERGKVKKKVKQLRTTPRGEIWLCQVSYRCAFCKNPVSRYDEVRI